MEQAKKEFAPARAPIEEPIKHSSRGFFWFIARGSQLKGPYSTQELRRLIEQKEISTRFYAWRDGFREWRPIYGVDEFASIQSGDESYEFPTVPTPGAPLSNPAAQLAQRPTVSNLPVFKVRFSRSRISDLRKSEVLTFFFVTLLFSLGIVEFSFHIFEQQWNYLWGRRVSSMVLRVGSQEDALPVGLIEPLLSAPGLQHQTENWVAVEMEASLEPKDPAILGGFALKSNVPTERLVPDYSWDPAHIFTRRVLVQGMLNLKEPKALVIEHAGLPFEPLLSKRRSHP